MNLKLARFVALSMASMSPLAPQVAGAEGGMSLYLPGAAGDMLLALSPEPGVQADQGLFVQTGSVGGTVRQGQVNLRLDADVVLNLTGASYTPDKKILSGSYTIGASAAYGNLNPEAAIQRPDGSTSGAGGDAFGLSDTAFVPLQLNWSVGE